MLRRLKRGVALAETSGITYKLISASDLGFEMGLKPRSKLGISNGFGADQMAEALTLAAGQGWLLTSVGWNNNGLPLTYLLQKAS